MRRDRTIRWTILGWLAAGLAAAVPLRAGGFALFEQGAKAAGQASAFTAEADDPSAVFYNPGGLAFLEKKQMSVGTTVTALASSQFKGLAPGLGNGTTGEQALLRTPTPQAFLAKPMGPRLRLGVGVYSPFSLATEWQNPSTFPGRYTNLTSEIRTFDVATTVGVRLGTHLGFGLGAVVRSSDLSHTRRLARFNPLAGLAGEVQDVASMAIDTGLKTGIGWTSGLLYRSTGGLSLGFAYRSAISIDYSGTGLLTQVLTGITAFDDLIAQALPFGDKLTMTTRVELPPVASFGVGLGGANARFEADVSRIGWSSLEQIAFHFPDDSTFDETVTLGLADSYSYRAGFAITRWTSTELRFGVALDRTPLPPEHLGPFFPDADSRSVAVGFGRDWLNVALLWTSLPGRTTQTNTDLEPTAPPTDPQPLYGTYSTERWQLVVTVTK